MERRNNLQESPLGISDSNQRSQKGCGSSQPEKIQNYGSEKAARFIGIDAGTETVKVTEVIRQGDCLRLGRCETVDHKKDPAAVLVNLLKQRHWSTIQAASVTGRFADRFKLQRIPQKQAQMRGCRHLFGDAPATIINIGAHGFSVLELRASGQAVFRENSRCSQGTGNFLRQLVERFGLTVAEAGRLCAEVADPAPLSGRCPVILKTDMTHLANKGETRPRILAGLFDAVCENILTLIKPGMSPSRVILTGGVSQSPRVRRVLAERLSGLGMTVIASDTDQVLYLQAIGCALIASEDNRPLPRLDELLLPARALRVERLPGLGVSLGNVRRMPPVPRARLNGESRRLVLGFDIGSTGSKAVALDLSSLETVWEGYRQTLGEPVAAAQDLLRQFTQSPAGKYSLRAFGSTGSGREIVGSLLTNCYGKNSVYVINEIVAHAAGARSLDPRVDTIFEIGGQDAKYIRLSEGRVIDCAMNEACSAGTGSFIEEQGRKFSDCPGPQELGRTALSACSGISLGQHCSVFMAEVIDEAVAAGVEIPEIVSGLYDSVIKNYLNRVKGNRSVGKVIFCQGMPFAADALAAAVARQTASEVVVPPNPGTVGALGVALLAARELGQGPLAELDPARFFHARVERKDTFVCRATRGCGGAGNCCRIERLRTVVDDHVSTFTWGGGCALHDQGTRKHKLPDLAPDPFRQREELRLELLRSLRPRTGTRLIALSDEFMLNGLFPFFAVFLYKLGFDLRVIRGATQELLKTGIQTANAPFCAPMQLFHGIARDMSESRADYLFIPLVRSTPHESGQRFSVTCPIVQATAKIIAGALGAHGGAAPQILSPVIDFDQHNLHSSSLLQSCESLAKQLGARNGNWHQAWEAGVQAQQEANLRCGQIGFDALEYCRSHGVTPVVVLGRDYTIHNRVLNANVPSILREQGAIGIPVDCMRVDPSTPIFRDVYWGYGQNILRAAHQIRRMPGVYALYCSNYSCGPDSFNLHFANYIMEGKPFAIIETDGHSGDAGTKTRVEAFLHCAQEDRQAGAAPPPNHFEQVQFSGRTLSSFGSQRTAPERMLMPFLGPASEVVIAIFRGLGWQAELLPAPTAESLKRGRRYTSGKECLPVPLILGSLLERLERAGESDRFVYAMPSTDGPCRFGVYNLLNQIVLKRLGWADRLRIWSPKDTGYFDDLPASTEMLVYSGILASDLITQATLDVRPLERCRGETDKLAEKCRSQLVELMESSARGQLSFGTALWNVISGRLFGVSALLRAFSHEFRELKVAGNLPTVEIAGEIYVRTVGFSNDFIVEKLEERGLQVYLAPSSEWIAYCGDVQRLQPGRNRLADGLSERIRHRIESVMFSAFGSAQDWFPTPSTQELSKAALPYVDPALQGEAILTLGGPLIEWRRGKIDGLVNVGPLECMPTKIAEAQLQLISEREGMPSLTLAFNGEPISGTALDDFAFEVKSRYQRMRASVKQTGAGAGSN